MSDAIITVENLAKKYTLRHAAAGPSYTALRDVLASRFKGLFRPLRSNNPTSSQEEFWALKDVSFEVKEGEVLGIIGRNGAGKSTLLKILSRITEPTKGRVTLRGRVASLLEVGTGFHPELTGRENIYLNGAILGMPKSEIRSKFDEIVSFAEVERFLDTPVKFYSSGMYVRLAFAVAAHLEPDILIVDEVLAVGDAEFQKRCLGKMKDVARGGRTVLMVSHQLGTLKRLCTRGLIMKEGGAQEFTSIESALHFYTREWALGTTIDLRNSLHIADVQFCGTEGSKSSVFYGEPFEVRISLKKLPSLSLGVTVSFKDHSGARLNLFSTNPHDGVALPRTTNFDLAFRLPFCCMAPGEYFIDIAVTEPNVRNVEEIQGALKFEVLPSALGGTLPYDSSFGVFFPEHSWRICNGMRDEAVA